MMCAAVAGQRGRRVLLIEHYHARRREDPHLAAAAAATSPTSTPGPANYLSQNPDFCRSALARYTPRDFIALVERHGIALAREEAGPAVLRRQRAAIIDLLRAECERGRVEWRQPCPVDGVDARGRRVRRRDAAGCRRARASLVVATGGLSVPKIGATPFGYRLAAQFGLPVVPPRPALVPLAFAPDALARFGDLAGVSLDAEVACGGGALPRAPAVHASRAVGAGDPADLVVLGRPRAAVDRHCCRASTPRRGSSPSAVGAARLDNLLATRLPRRFAQAWCEAHDVARPVRELSERRVREIAAGLHRWQVLPSGTLGWNKAEVTLGGVDTRALSSKTMAATAVPGLHFVGEVVDVTGWLGGYNFQWAWASGHAAGQAV